MTSNSKNNNKDFLKPNNPFKNSASTPPRQTTPLKRPVVRPSVPSINEQTASSERKSTYKQPDTKTTQVPNTADKNRNINKKPEVEEQKNNSKINSQLRNIGNSPGFIQRLITLKTTNSDENTDKTKEETNKEVKTSQNESAINNRASAISSGSRLASGSSSTGLTSSRLASSTSSGMLGGLATSSSSSTSSSRLASNTSSGLSTSNSNNTSSSRLSHSTSSSSPSSFSPSRFSSGLSAGTSSSNSVSSRLTNNSSINSSDTKRATNSTNSHVESSMQSMQRLAQSLLNKTPVPPSALSSSMNSKGKPDYSEDIEIDGLTNFEFNSLRDFLYEKSGIYVTDSRRYLFKNRLVGRLAELNLKTYKEYYNYLLKNDPQRKELNKFYEQMTTNETSFFRNLPQLETVDEIVFKRLISQAGTNRKIRIWSAGCSSGEEPYTIAIMFYELLGSQIGSWDIKINARDLSPAVLKAAQEGLYNNYTLRSTPKAYIEKYFTQEGELFRIKPEIKKLVDFGQINLNDKKQTSQLEPSNVIFCRNVIIYFDDDVKTNVITAFYDNLLPNGSLIIGHSESLNTIKNSFVVSHHKSTQIYHKNE